MEKLVKQVGIGKMMLSRESTEILVAPNLGSCLGLAVYDPLNRLGAMIHCLLPLSKSNPEKAASEPFTYVDTGVVEMLNQILKICSDRKNLVVVAAGCSNINDQNNVFEIGKKNYTVLRKVLWKNNFLMKAEHVGENHSRTFSLDIETGEIAVKCQGEVIKLV